MSFHYDGYGRKMVKTTPSSKYYYYYDLMGPQVAELDSSGNWLRGEVYAGGKHLATYTGGTSGNTYFDHGDWLATERVRTDISGNVCESISSLPFGDNQVSSGSCADASPMHFQAAMTCTHNCSVQHAPLILKFTGKPCPERSRRDRDAESNLDDFGARYYSSTMGRWTSPDYSDAPVAVPYADLTNPQTLNLYALVRDNPETFSDLDGHLLSAYTMQLYGISEGMGSGVNNIAGGGVIDVTEVHNVVCTFCGSVQNQSNGSQAAYDPSKTGPADPTDPSKPLFQNKQVRDKSDQAFMRTINGTARDGLAEAGFAIEYKNGKISFGPIVDSLHNSDKANRLSISTDKNTIAILHTHGNGANPNSSVQDRTSNLPNVVRSQRALYVTVPGTTNSIQLIPATPN